MTSATKKDHPCRLVVSLKATGKSVVRERELVKLFCILQRLYFWQQTELKSFWGAARAARTLLFSVSASEERVLTLPSAAGNLKSRKVCLRTDGRMDSWQKESEPPRALSMFG